MAKLPGAIQGARVVGEKFVHSQRHANPEGRMPLMDHIRELRNRVVKAALAIIVGMSVALVFSDKSWNIVTRPFCEATIRGLHGCHQAGDQLVVTGVFDPFFLRLKIAFFIGLIIACPVWLYQLWAFIAPGLYSREKRWSYIFVGSAVPLFLGGAVLAYVAMGRGLHYLLGLTPAGVLNLPSVDTYLSYFISMLIGFGLAFELPLFIIMLNLAGILSHERFRKWRKLMFFAVFLVAGMVNPSPDPWTMLVLGGICIVLVEVAEVFVIFNDRRRGRRVPYAGLSEEELAALQRDDSAMHDDPALEE
jgi:sec-independent protein translocase protein TatC